MIQLQQDQFHRLAGLLSTVKINHLFARSVIQGKIPGTVHVDRLENPRAGYVLHSYGMALLFGETDMPDFREGLWQYLNDPTGKRTMDEWLQVYPDAWAGEVESNCKRLERHQRVNFKFSPEACAASKADWDTTAWNGTVVRTDQLDGVEITGSVVPRYFWKDGEDFRRNGVGCSVVVGDAIVSTAFSAFIHGNQLEIGIETAAGHRGEGHALRACAALIDYCMENAMEPVWACRMENKASFNLARKLGFEPTAFLPYFRFQPVVQAS